MSTIIMGFNRSGTNVINSIVKELNLKNKVKFKSDIFEKKKFDNFYNNFKKESKKNSLNFSSYSAVKFNKLDFFSADSNNFIYIENISFKKEKIVEIFRVYAKPNNKMINQFLDNGSKIINVIRNPLDILVSNAFEIENFTEYMYPNLFKKEVFEKNRMLYGNYYLQNKNWLNSLINNISRYYLQSIKYENDTEKIFYEDLLNNPIKEIKKIGQFLNIPSNSYDAPSIWQKIGMKNLKKYKTHFFKPSLNKYKEYLDPEIQKKLVKKPELKKILNHYGYIFEISNNFHSFENKSVSRINKLIEIRNLLQKVQFNIDIEFNNKFIKSTSLNVKKNKINFYSNSDTLLKVFKNKLVSFFD